MTALERLIDAHRLATVECWDAIKPLVERGTPDVSSLIEFGPEGEIEWPDDLVAMVIWLHGDKVREAICSVFETTVSDVTDKLASMVKAERAKRGLM